MKWLEGWNDRIILAVDHTQLQGVVYKLPVLLTIDSALIDFSKVQDDGADIRLVPANHSKLLPYEFEVFDKGNGIMKLWVLLDALPTNVPTFFFLYYNNPSAEPGEDPAALWSGCNCVLCMHFKPNDLFADSTGLNTISSNSGSTVTSTEGPIGTSWDVNTNSEAIFPYIDAYHLNMWTFEFYGYQKTTSIYWNGIMGTRFGSDYTFDAKIKNDSNKNIHKARIDVGDGSGWIHYEDYGQNVLVEWVHMGFTVDSSIKRLSYFQNGSRTDGYNYSSGVPLFMKSNQTLHVGRSRPASGEYGRWIMEELRIFSDVKTNAWMNASYKAFQNQLVVYDQSTVTDMIPKPIAVFHGITF